MNKESPEALRARLNAGTGRIGWTELAPHFARGVVVRVEKGLDLVEVAACFVEDRRDRVAIWMSDGQVAAATEDDARAWTENEPAFWAVVAAPWVLVQEAGDD
ncbi:MAG: DUF2288 domain-containing protein [Proteobacteria bacterium]|nr:DUF2288 domain-containing protein [Pseudomonadota bacterium]